MQRPALGSTTSFGNEDSIMRSLGLSTDEFDQALRIYQRLLVTDFAPAADAKPFLISHLRRDFPETAGKIQSLDQGQLDQLWSILSSAVCNGTDSTLWQ
jgi:hypothetical protein